MKRKHKKLSPFTIILLVILSLYSFTICYALFWGLQSSLKTVDEFRQNVIGFPKHLTFKNYPFVFSNFVVVTPSISGKMKNIYIETQLLNTVIYVLGASFVSCGMPFLTAYLTNKFKGPLSTIIYGIVVVTMVMPIVGAYPSELQLLKKLNLFDKFSGVFLMRATFLGVYYMVFYAAFSGISKEYQEAAYIDGASEMCVMLRVIMPLASNVFFSTLLVHIISYWNDYQAPLLYIPSHPTLAYGLYYMNTSPTPGMGYVPMKMIGVMILVIPILITFIAFKKKIMGNISLGGIKE